MTISFQVKVFADEIDRQKGIAAATSGAEEIQRKCPPPGIGRRGAHQVSCRLNLAPLPKLSSQNIKTRKLIHLGALANVPL
jgi:hypothetical protein